MKLKKGVRVVIAITSIILLGALLKSNVNLPTLGKLMYGLIIITPINILASFKY